MKHKPKNQKSSNGRKIARIVSIWTIFSPNRARRSDLDFKKKLRVVLALVAVVVVIVVVVVVVVAVVVVVVRTFEIQKSTLSEMY